ncbi:MAG: phosphomannomutase/phosphoglucomutase [Candidatus Brocadiales bacterium]
MAEDNNQHRRCMGEKYDITIPVCRERQRRSYPKCMVCLHRTITNTPVQLSKRMEEVDIFKSYDIRGIYPDEINEEKAQKIGFAIVDFLKQLKGTVKNIVVGRDMRVSSSSLADSLIKGITNAGANAIDIGLVSTETTYFSVGYYRYDGGIMVTASHNPAVYNGFKVCREQAVPISFDTGLSKVAHLAMQPHTASKKCGTVVKKDVLQDYKSHVLNFVQYIKPLHVVIDAGNGMAGKMAPLVFEELPCKLTMLYPKLDGTFPNHPPDPLVAENTKELQLTVPKVGADLGVAFDGDADRCVFIDEKGQIITNDLITALIARKYLTMEPKATVVYDLRSSRTVPEEIIAAGGVPYRERVGHSHIKATMRETDAVFGGELSGHFYFRNNYYADSGLIALVEVLNIISERNDKFSNILAPLHRYYSTGEINFEVLDKDEKIRKLAKQFANGRVDYLDGITAEYDDWWFNVRKSNTQPLLRLNLEAKTKELMEKNMKAVVRIIKAKG